MKALIGFKAFYFFGSVSVRFRCICEMALTINSMNRNHATEQYGNIIKCDMFIYSESSLLTNTFKIKQTSYYIEDILHGCLCFIK